MDRNLNLGLTTNRQGFHASYFTSLGPRCLLWKAGIILVPTEQIRKCRCSPVSWGLPAPLRSPQDQCEAPRWGPETRPRISAEPSGWGRGSGPCLCCHLSPPATLRSPERVICPFLCLHQNALPLLEVWRQWGQGRKARKELPLNRANTLRSLRCWETFPCASAAQPQSPRPQPLTGLVPPALSALPSAFPPTVPSVRGLLGLPTSSCPSPSRCFPAHPSQPGAPEQNHLHLMEPPS